MIRKFLKKDYWYRPAFQYNALMLTRILADNPGATFTRNLDVKFADALKDLLRNGRDLSVRQMLMETLDSFQHQKGWDEGLAPVLEMWKKEKEKAYKAYGVCDLYARRGRGDGINMSQGRAPPPPPPTTMMNGPPNPHSQNYFARAHSNNRLPNPAELATRLEEARTSAKLLTQLVANTPSTEVLNNDLVKEFADRCLSASRSIQGYMTAENPSPDNETMETLIDVNEELQQALNNEKRATLSARKELGIGDRSQNPSPQPETNGLSRPLMASAPGGSFSGGGGAFIPPVPRRPDAGKGKGRQEPSPLEYVPPSGPPPGRAALGPVSPISVSEDDHDPFRDPEPITSSASYKGKAPVGALVLEQPNLDSEPFHPGFSQPTQSYLGRQDSALNKVQMHGAGSSSYDDEDADKEVVTGSRQYAGGSSSSSDRRQASKDDIYGVDEPRSSSGKKPAY